MWYYLEQISADSTVLGFFAVPNPMGQTGASGANTACARFPGFLTPNADGHFPAPGCNRNRSH